MQYLRSIESGINKLFQRLDVLQNAKIFVKLRFLCRIFKPPSHLPFAEF